jgi:hypothetical protein
MSRLEIITSILLVISTIFSVGMLVYTRTVIVKLLSVSEELGDLQEMINIFTNHTRDVYEMDMFYGDETLKGLLEHAISLNEHMATFEYIYNLTEEAEEKETDEADNRAAQEEA